MQHDLYQTYYPDRARDVLDGLQMQIARGQPGCTVTGNRITVRWNIGKRLVSIHAVIIEVDDGIDGEMCAACGELAVFDDDCAACGFDGEDK